MEERQVTVDGVTYFLESPFIVVATQNPIEMEGTYPLPEAQRDRFMARVSMGYPSPRAELDMLSSHGSSSPLDAVKPVATAADVRRLVATARSVWVSDAVKQYVVDLAGATRASSDLRLGASPARPCTCCGPPARRRPSRAATTCCRTTCRALPQPCWPTACCSRPTPCSRAARRSTW
jgi:MoxR-like ATPase